MTIRFRHGGVRLLLSILLLGCSGSLSLAAPSHGETRSFTFADQAGSVRIELTGSVGPKTRIALREFLEVWDRRYHWSPVMDDSTSGRWRPAIRIGDDLFRGWRGGLNRSLDRDSHAVWITPRRVYLSGANDQAIAFAIYAFMESQLGVRWYWPGALGRYIPSESPPLRFEPFFRMEQPDFHCRIFSGLGGGEGVEWMERNRLSRRYFGGHNLHRIFQRQDYLLNPQFYPHPLDLEQPPPEGASQWYDQPDLSRMDVARHAARAAEVAALREPKRRAFSLGINDNSRFGDSPGIRALTHPPRFFRQRPNYSNLVVGFTNRVAELTDDTVPHLRLSMLAYWVAEAPPEMPVHPRVMPWLTFDAAQNYDPQVRAVDREVVRGWARQTRGDFGVYDYAYGSSMTVPRLPVSLFVDRMRYARAAGARGYRAEVYPLWGWDGGKAWVMARLTREVNQDYRGLLEQYYREFFGAAADPVRAYHEQAERVWLAIEGQGQWIRFFRDEAVVGIYASADMDRFDAWIEEARARAAKDSPAVRERVERLAELHELFDASWRWQRSREALAHLTAASDPDELGEWVVAFAEARRHFNQWVRVLPEISPHHLNVARLNFVRSDPIPHALRVVLDPLPLAEVETWMEAMEPAIEAVGDPESDYHLQLYAYERQYAFLWEIVPDQHLWAGITPGRYHWEDLGEWKEWRVEYEKTDTLNVMVSEDGMSTRGSTFTRYRYPFELGEARLVRARLEVSAQVGGGNRSFAYLQFRDQRGRLLARGSILRVPPGSWENHGVILASDVPPRAARGELVVGTYRQQPEDFFKVKGARIERFQARTQAGDSLE